MNKEKSVNAEGGKPKVFKDAEVEIHGNIMLCKDYFLQLSNITQVNTGQLERPPIDWKYVLIPAVIAGAGRFIAGNNALLGAVSNLLGIFSLCALCYMLYKRFSPQPYGVDVEVSSGGNYFFVSHDKEFCDNVFGTISAIIAEEKHSQEYLINFGSGTIINKLTGGV